MYILQTKIEVILTRIPEYIYMHRMTIIHIINVGLQVTDTYKE